MPPANFQTTLQLVVCRRTLHSPALEIMVSSSMTSLDAMFSMLHPLYYTHIGTSSHTVLPPYVYTTFTQICDCALATDGCIP